MAVESSRETGEEQVASLIDDLIHDIFSESGPSAATSAQGAAATSALIESAFGGTRGQRISTLERLLLAEAFAAELADALAPALAEQLAPRLLKALDQVAAGQPEGKQPQAGGRPGGQRKPGAK
jgi:hypothetical protein